MSIFKRIFKRGPKTSVQETSSSFQIVKDGLVIQSLRKDAINSAQIGINDPNVGRAGLVFYLNTSDGNGMKFPYYLSGVEAVEAYILALPGVNKNRLMAMAESGEIVTFDVWRRG